MRKLHGLILGLAVVAGSLDAQTGERMGGVSGVVRSPDGTPVAGVTVGYLRQPPFNRSAGKKVSARTGTDGSFQLTGMAAGSYTICVQGPPDAGWLDPCLWSDPPEAVHLTPGQSLTALTITLRRATTLEVRVTDPGRFLDDNEGKRPLSQAIFGVWTPKRVFVRAHRSTANATSRVYLVAVPQATPLRVGVISSLYQLRGEGRRGDRRRAGPG